MEGVVTAGLALSVFTLFFLVNKRNKTKADLLLAGLLFTFTIPLLVGFIAKIHPPARQFLPIVLGPYWMLLSGPLLYFYARDLSEEHFRFRPIQLLHLLPFVLFLVYFVFFSSRGFGPGMELAEAPGPRPGMRPPRDVIFNRVPFGVFHFLSLLVYVSLTLFTIRKHRRRLGDYFSYTQQEITLNWLFWSALILLLSFVTVAVIEFLTNKGTGPNFTLLNIANMLLIFVFGYYGIRQTLIFAAPDRGSHTQVPAAVAEEQQAPAPGLSHAHASEMSEEPENTDAEEDREKYEKSGVKREEVDALLQKINTFVEREKPYVNSRLTIEELAAMLDMSKHHISQIINEAMGVNFFTYINQYRIAEFKTRLMDPAHKHLTILAIALDSGFNSKSGFNAIFKRMTGQTPGEYKKEQESQQSH